MIGGVANGSTTGQGHRFHQIDPLQRGTTRLRIGQVGTGWEIEQVEKSKSFFVGSGDDINGLLESLRVVVCEYSRIEVLC